MPFYRPLDTFTKLKLLRYFLAKHEYGLFGALTALSLLIWGNTMFEAARVYSIFKRDN